MSINSISLDLPAKLEEIFNFSFNFDGLKKIIEFFQKNNYVLVSTLKDFDKRISLFESLKLDIDSIKIKSLNIEKTNEVINNSFTNIKEKLISLETKLNNYSKISEENSEVIKKQKYMTEDHERNINKLNIYIEENYKSIKEIMENYNAIKKKVDLNSLKVNELENKSIEAMDLIRGNSGNINKEKLTTNQEMEIINSNITNLTNTINNMKKMSEIKNKEYDKYINEILKNIKGPHKPINSTKSLEFAFMENIDNTHNIHNNSFFEEEDNIYKSDLEKDNKYNKLFEEFKLKEKKLKEENKLNKKSIKEIQNNINNINEKFNNLLGENKDIISNKNNKDFDYITTDKYKIISDNMKLLSVALNTKPSQEDFESLKRNIDLRLKKLEILQNTSLDVKNQLRESQDQKDNQSLMESKTIEYIIEKIQLTLNENITPLIKDSILKYGKNIDLSSNYIIREIIKNNKKYYDEINKTIISTIEKRNQLIKDIEEKIEYMNEERIKLIENNNANNIKLNDITKLLDGSDTEEEVNKNNLNKGNIRERLMRLSDLYYEVRDRCVLLEKKSLAFTREVKEDIKSNLKNETTKIVEQFKTKLSSFTYKFEDELKNKIDQIGLYSFEKRINSKLFTELKEKINKNDLKKKTNVINRKIDSLENKISQTLVDTIIDIQMDETTIKYFINILYIF